MCGIVGYIGSQQAAPILIEGLERLEYRGYDSAGVSVFTESGLEVIKTRGRLKILSDLIDGGNAIEGTAGLGHTRWATHGQPSDENSHPHLSCSGRIAVVHNGIIENYLKLREVLQQKGIVFSSETDTEVVAQLIDFYYEGDLIDAVEKTISVLEGSYALGIMSADYPDRLIAVRKDNPLILAFGESGNFLASDVTAVLRYTRNVSYLNDGELAVIKRDGVSVYNQFMEEVQKEIVCIDWDVEAAEKGGHPHFMFKEMLEQPKVIRDTLSPRLKDGRVLFDELHIDPEFFRNTDKIYIIACGSAYHVGVVMRYNLEKVARKRTEAVLASEFRYCSPMVDEKTLAIIISQSGETADTLAAMREAKRLGARTLGIVNVVGSSIAKEADDVIYTWAGPEIAVATTKAYSAQLAVSYLLTLYISDLCGTISEEDYSEIIDELIKLPDKVQSIIDNRELLSYYASLYFNNTSIFFIGRNIDYAVALEGSLKLKEISYIHSEAYAAGELKHGTISLIEEGTLVVALASYEKLFDKLMSNVKEVKARGADVLGFAFEDYKNEIEKTVDSSFVFVRTHEMLAPSLEVVPLQLFSYYVALLRGCDIDKPRNLAKSVTVE